MRALQQFEREGFAGFAPAYARRDLLRGRPVAAVDAAKAEASVAGIAEGVAPNGALRVRTDGGALREIISGEVSVRLAASAP